MTAAAPLPAAYPLTLYRGDTRIWTILVEDIDDEGVRTPRPLGGYEFDTEIRATKDDTVVMAEITAEAGAADPDDPDDPDCGVLILTLTADESEKLVPGTAWWDLEFTRISDGFVRTFLAGRCKVGGDVSRA